VTHPTIQSLHPWSKYFDDFLLLNLNGDFGDTAFERIVPAENICVQYASFREAHMPYPENERNRLLSAATHASLF
jgi:hypothetical protein